MVTLDVLSKRFAANLNWTKLNQRLPSRNCITVSLWSREFFMIPAMNQLLSKLKFWYLVREGNFIDHACTEPVQFWAATIFYCSTASTLLQNETILQLKEKNCYGLAKTLKLRGGSDTSLLRIQSFGCRGLKCFCVHTPLLYWKHSLI